MRSRAKKKVMGFKDKEEDRISLLPDELIHKILSFLDAKVAVQSSVLSKRWKLIWTTLPFLNFGRYDHSEPQNTYMFITHVLSNRNHQSHVSELKMCVSKCINSDSLDEKFVEYAISHNVEYLNLDSLYSHKPYKLSTFSSKSLKKLALRVKLEECASESDCWDIPALTSLHLVDPYMFGTPKLPESCLTSLPALRTLCLDSWDLSRSSFSFSLPNLTTLHMSWCRLPQTIWNYPALSSLEIVGVDFPNNMSDIFSTLVNLQNLKLFLTRSSMTQYHSISCPQLLGLNIRNRCSDSGDGSIEVLAPKLCNFSSVGIFSITLEVPELENVDIKLDGWFGNMDWIYRKKYYRRFTDMLSGLGNAKILTFDLESIQTLSATDFLASSPSPFYNLKIVKLPLGYKESSISGALRSYLLGGSPRATIVTTLPENNVNHQAVPVSLTSQKVMIDKPLATPTNVNSVVDADRVRQVGVPVAGTINDRGSSSRGNSDFGLWQGHVVNSEFVGLLDLIMKKYPETFEHVTAKSERFYTMMLNMLCTSVNDFLRTSMTEFNTDFITEYRDLFADLQRWGFNVKWLVSHLNYIEKLRFSQHELHAIDSHMDDTKNKLQDMQTHCLEKITKIQKASG